MVNRSSFNTIIPPKYFTKVKMLLVGYIAPGRNGGFCSIYGNTLYQPFLTGTSPSGAPAPSYLGLTPQGGTAFAQQFPGYSQLSALYQNYRVHASNLKVLATCSGVGDTYTISSCVIPENNMSIVSTLTQDSIMVQPHGKFRLVNPYMKAGLLKTFVKCRNVMGLSKNQYNDGIPHKFTTSPITSQYNFSYVILWTTNNGANAAQQLYLDIELEYFVEFNSPINAIV
jgi:hypothetical protein